MKKHWSILIFITASVFICIIAGLIYNKKSNLKDFEEIISAGELRVATDYNSIGYYISKDSILGFQYELVNALCDSLHIKPVWTIENDLTKSLDLLRKGKIDLIARNIPITTELRQTVAFSHPIAQLPQVLVQRKAAYNSGITPIRSQLALAGKTVYIPYKSPNILRLKNLADEIADTIIIKEIPNYETEQLMMMVAKGDIDFAVCDRLSAQKNLESLPELDIATAISFTQMQAWAMRPESEELKQKVDSFLIDFLQTKQYRDIYRTYYK
jgi:membrane-bound lytic murein transglycosylase MltF